MQGQGTFLIQRNNPAGIRLFVPAEKIKRKTYGPTLPPPQTYPNLSSGNMPPSMRRQTSRAKNSTEAHMADASKLSHALDLIKKKKALRNEEELSGVPRATRAQIKQALQHNKVQDLHLLLNPEENRRVRKRTLPCTAEKLIC